MTDTIVAKVKAVIKVCTTVLWIFAVAAVASVLYVLFLDRPYLSYPNSPFPTIGTTFHKGDVVPIEVVRCNSAAETKNVIGIKALINITRTAPSIPVTNMVTLVPGCIGPFLITVNRLPDDLPPGVYRYVGKSEVNGIHRTFDVNWSTQDFEVLP